MLRRLAMVAALAAWGAAVASAQEIFWDGFEQGDLCAWTNPQASVTHELEAYNQSGSNDTPADAELISRCAVVEGTIGDPYNPPGPPDTLDDFDYYQIDVEGPALLRVKLERIGVDSLFQPYGEIDNTSPFESFGFLPLGEPEVDPAMAARQIFLPENGFSFLDPPTLFPDKNLPADNKWYLLVLDDRNNAGSPSCPCGGQTNTYRLTLTIDPVVGQNLPFPYSQEAVQMPADGSLLIYRLDGATTPSLDLAETFSSRVDPQNYVLDTKLYLVRKSGNQLVTVVGDDDFALNKTGDDFVHFDSQIETQSLQASPYFVVVDDYAALVRGAIDFNLSIQFPQGLRP